MDASKAATGLTSISRGMSWCAAARVFAHHPRLHDELVRTPSPRELELRALYRSEHRVRLWTGRSARLRTTGTSLTVGVLQYERSATSLDAPRAPRGQFRVGSLADAELEGRESLERCLDLPIPCPENMREWLSQREAPAQVANTAVETATGSHNETQHTHRLPPDAGVRPVVPFNTSNVVSAGEERSTSTDGQLNPCKASSIDTHLRSVSPAHVIGKSVEMSGAASTWSIRRLDWTS